MITFQDELYNRTFFEVCWDDIFNQCIRFDSLSCPYLCVSWHQPVRKEERFQFSFFVLLKKVNIVIAHQNYWVVLSCITANSQWQLWQKHFRNFLVGQYERLIKRFFIFPPRCFYSTQMLLTRDSVYVVISVRFLGLNDLGIESSSATPLVLSCNERFLSFLAHSEIFITHLPQTDIVIHFGP